MQFATLKVAGADAIRLLNDHRARYQASGQYPFLIGDADDLRRLYEAAQFNRQDPAEIVRASLAITIADWIGTRRKEEEEYEFPFDEIMGEWPGEVLDKGSIGLHKELTSGEFKPEVYLGLAKIETPWHLPAVLKYGAWNACPAPEVHCAFHREWQQRFGSEIMGMSGDVVECLVKNPPSEREVATILAWEQYWYCADIVEQGCGSVSKLAATVMKSPHWYFWWD